MRFQIVTYCQEVNDDMEDYQPFYNSIRKQYAQKGVLGLLPLPLNYVVLRGGNIAWIRVVKQDRKFGQKRLRSSRQSPGNLNYRRGSVAWHQCSCGGTGNAALTISKRRNCQA